MRAIAVVQPLRLDVGRWALGSETDCLWAVIFVILDKKQISPHGCNNTMTGHWILSASSIAVLYFCFSLITGFRRNVAQAKRTGLPYVIVPVHITSVPWILLQPVCLPLLGSLPESWTRTWLP